LPATDELAEHAVAAEEMLETLRADAELVGGLETGMDVMLASAEEQAILKEFEDVDEKPKVAARPAQQRQSSPAAPKADSRRAPERSADEPGSAPGSASRRPADPEAM